MGSRTWVFLAMAGAIAMAVAGCGSAKSFTTSTAPGIASGQAAPGTQAASVNFRARVLSNREFPGFTPESQPIIASTPQTWLADDATPANQIPSEAGRLERRGFVAGEHEVMTGGYGQMAVISVVEQFRDPAGARSELATVLAASKRAVGPSDHYFTFGAPGIPTAEGFGDSSVGSGRINVVFTDGDYYYLEGEAGGLSALKRPALIAAAQHLYNRVSAWDRGGTRIALASEVSTA